MQLATVPGILAFLFMAFFVALLLIPIYFLGWLLGLV
jgi:hypothetical protein